MDKKLTDLEIVKALEICTTNSASCKDCFHSYVCEQFNEHRECDNKKCHFANDHFVPTDLINRLETKNSNLQKKNSNLISNLTSLQKYIVQKEAEVERLKKGWKADVILTANVKSEAYKEFAERLKENKEVMFFGESGYHYRITDEQIDNLLKELVGEDDG